MGRKNKEVPEDIKKLIVQHYNNGLSEQKIADLVARPRTTVHFILKKWKNNHSLENKTRCGRPKVLSETDERWLVRLVKKEPKTNATILSKSVKEHLNIDVTTQTIRNYLKTNNYRGRVARRKPYISKKIERRDYILQKHI